MKYKHKLFLILLLSTLVAATLSFLVPRGYAAEGLYESYSVNNYQGDSHDVNWQAQTFTVGATAHNVTSIWLKMYRYLYPETVTVSVKAVDGAHKPTAGDLWVDTLNASEFTADSSGVWYHFVAASINLVAATEYSIVVRALAPIGTAAVMWKQNNPGPSWAGYTDWYSTDSGVNWYTNPSYPRQYDFQIWGDDILSPVYTNIAHSTTYTGSLCTFSSNWSDNAALDYGIFSTNNTGPWVNDTIHRFLYTPSWFNVTKTLNDTVGTTVGYRWYTVNDTSNNLNTTTTFTLTTTAAPFGYTIFPLNTTDAGDTCLFSSYWVDGTGLSGYIFETNNTGHAVNETWTPLAGLADWANVTKVLNSTIGVTVCYRWYANSTAGLWSTTDEYYNTDDDTWISVFGTQWYAQTFLVGAAGHNVTSVKLKLLRVGLPGTLTVGIRATALITGWWKPTGADVANGTIDGDTLTTDGGGLWYDIIMTYPAASEYTLIAATRYAIVVRAIAGTPIKVVGWRCDGSGPTYAGGSYFASGDSGATWGALPTYDFMFEIRYNVLGSGGWLVTPEYNVITTDPALTHPIYPPWSIPYYVPFLGKCMDIIGCFGVIGLMFANTKTMKGGLKAMVITFLIGIIFLVIWFVMTSLEAYA